MIKKIVIKNGGRVLAELTIMEEGINSEKMIRGALDILREGLTPNRNPAILTVEYL